MIGTDTRVDLAASQLDSSIASVEENAQLLDEYAANDAIRKALEDATQTWHQYRQLALTQPDREQSSELLRLAERFLGQSEALVQEIERHSGSQAARLVNRSGRQRMLSQIGRAPCRERVCQSMSISVGAVSLKKNKNTKSKI